MPVHAGSHPQARRRTPPLSIRAAALAVCLTAWAPHPSGLAQPADAAGESTVSIASLRARAFESAYNLDYPEAVRLFEQALARDPADARTHRGLAAIVWLHMIFERGSITVDQYLGGLSRRDVKLDEPPADDAALFARHVTKAIELSERRVEANPADVEALYDLGAAVGLQASYTATIEGRIGGAFRSARRAYDLHERVLELDPSRHEAGLIVGTYRYVVSTLALPVRWMAYLVGFGRDETRGLALIEAAARSSNDAQEDARFALMLLYNREKRFDEALGVVRTLMARFPRNRLLLLEAGGTAIRARRFGDAERMLTEGIARLAGDPRPRAFGEEALWFYKRGLARRALGRLETAHADLQRARELSARQWVHARVALELGKLADLQGRRDAARAAYETAARLARAGNDPGTRAEAERFRRTPFR
jgi:tetratricopeptide (TPR) repeat protein